MKTSRTISNISYNTLDHFCGVVYDLVNRGIIEWCYWIFHHAEKDELKDHIHFVLKPSGRLETSDLAKEFLELDLMNPKPLGVTAKWNYTASLDDWILYCMHHPGYLASKGQIRDYAYQVEDFGATDMDAFLEDVKSINQMQFQRLQVVADAVKNHVPFAMIVQNGMIPIAQRNQYYEQYKALWALQVDEKTGRRQSHEEKNPDQIPGQMMIDQLR